jgi:hypothetical protein
LLRDRERFLLFFASLRSFSLRTRDPKTELDLDASAVWCSEPPFEMFEIIGGSGVTTGDAVVDGEPAAIVGGLGPEVEGRPGLRFDRCAWLLALRCLLLLAAAAVGQGYQKLRCARV